MTHTAHPPPFPFRYFSQNAELFPNLIRFRQFWEVSLLDITHTAHPPRFSFSQFHTKSCTFSRTCQNSPILKDTLVRYDPHGSSTSIPFFAISSKMLYFSNLTRIRQFWDVRLLDMIHTAHPPRFPLQQFPAKCCTFSKSHKNWPIPG